MSLIDGISTTVNTAVLTAGNAVPADLKDITPKWDGAPFLDGLVKIAGWVIAACLILDLILLVVGIVVAVAGQISNSGYRDSGVKVIVYALFAAAVLGGAATFVAWAQNWNLFG